MTDDEVRVFCGHEVKVTRALDNAEFTGRLEPDLEKLGTFHLWIGQQPTDDPPDPAGPREDFLLADFGQIESVNV